MTIKEGWIYVRDGEVRGFFYNREEAVEYLIEILKQSLKDMGKNQKEGIYTYDIIIPKTEIKKFKKRDAEFAF